MKIKKIFPLFFLILIQSGNMFSQQNMDAVIKGYNSMYEYLYFDSVNKLSNYKLCDFKNSYDFYVTFKVDTTGSVIDLEIIQFPGNELPIFIKAYVEKLIRSSNGLWLPQIKDSKKVMSDEFMYQVSLTKKNQSIEDRVRDNQPLIDYFFLSENKVDKIEKISFSPKKRLLPLSY
jgi:hypothetical protein